MMTLLRGQKSPDEGHLLSASNHDLSRVSTSFDETNLVPNAGLLPAAVLAQRIHLAGLVDSRLKLARHGANSGAKALSVIGSMLAGGVSIDDVTVLRAARPARCSTALGRRRRSGRGCGRTGTPELPAQATAVMKRADEFCAAGGPADAAAVTGELRAFHDWSISELVRQYEAAEPTRRLSRTS